MATAVLIAAMVVAGGCMSVQKVELPPKPLQDEIRRGGVVAVGDHVTVVSTGQGEQTFVVTEVDQDVIRGASMDVPIDEVVSLEKRKVDPVRTGLAAYGGLYLAVVAGILVSWLVAALI